MKALEIFEQDVIDREQGSALPRQQYYIALRDALHRELMQQGYSDLLEKLLLDVRGGMERIYVVDYAVLTECHSMIVLDRDVRDVAEFVPHLHLRGGKARWADVEGQGNFFMPVSRDLPEKLRQLRSVSRQLVDARDDTVIPQADDAAQREIEQVHLLNKMLDDRCRSLQEERDALQSRVRQLEEGVISDQVRFAIEARRLQEEENLRSKYAEQEDAAREAFRSQFAKEIEELQRQREEAARETASQREEAAAEYADVRREVGDAMAELAEAIKAQSAEWRRELDRSECRMLAQSYAALHEMYHEDMKALLVEARSMETPYSVQEGLTGLHSQLGDRLNQLEQAMVRLGLTVYRPAMGEEYDRKLHIQKASHGTIVMRCVRPGVMVHGSAEPLLKAEVELGWREGEI